MLHAAAISLLLQSIAAENYPFCKFSKLPVCLQICQCSTTLQPVMLQLSATVVSVMRMLLSPHLS